MFWIDPLYLWIAVITLVMSFAVQSYLKSTFAKWSAVGNALNLNGMEVTQVLFRQTSLKAIPVERVGGSLTDHFDPGANVVRLSEPVAGRSSVASMAVAAHELGHVQQYQTGSALIAARSFLLPALQFSPTLSYICILFGFLFELSGLVWLGVIFFALMVVFSLLTLPVEFDASRRGLALLSEAGLLTNPADAQGAKAVLRAAGLTYLAAAVASILQLLYYVALARRSS
jgi:hypothetical protein